MIIFQEDKTILHLYTLNNIASKSTKQDVTELKKEINPQSRLEIFNSPVSVTKRTSRQTNKQTNTPMMI